MGLLGSILGTDSAQKEAERASRRARQAEEQRQQRIEAGTGRIRSSFADAFTPQYYAGIEKDYLQYAKPQLDRQYQDQQRNLVFALNRSGLLDSSVRGDKFGRLQFDNDLATQRIGDRGRQIAMDRRLTVENAMADTLSQLHLTADPDAAAAQASNRVRALTPPPAYEPLAQLFQDATAGLATQAELERRGQSRYNTGWFPGVTPFSGGKSYTVRGGG